MSRDDIDVSLAGAHSLAFLTQSVIYSIKQIVCVTSKLLTLQASKGISEKYKVSESDFLDVCFR